MGTLVHRRITRLRAQLVEAESFGVSEEACDGEAFTSAMLKIAPPAYPRSEIIFIFSRLWLYVRCHADSSIVLHFVPALDPLTRG